MIFKCKMCGGELSIAQRQNICECDYCGSIQTLPKIDDDRKANMYDRANHFRRNNEFDKAVSVYEKLLAEDSTDAEAYWSLVLCRFGIEYVEDPATHKRVPTVNRAQYTSIFDDDNYKQALAHADIQQKLVYEDEAKTINEIQKGILAISQKEEPFDVFICYKETDTSGRRTQDSVLANDLYHQLKQEGFKVFFSRITLEDKLGVAYEPYIFATLNSAKVMVVLGTKPEYFNAVWVKNEWSRYLAIVKQSAGKKVLIPAYRDMDPYDLPEEFSHLQAQDMSKLGFMQDLIRGIKKILQSAKTTTPVQQVVQQTVVNNTGSDIAPLYKRAQLFLEDGDFSSAIDYANRILDMNPEYAQAYMVKVLASRKCRNEQELEERRAEENLPDDPDMRKAVRFAGDGEEYSRIAGRVAENAFFAQILKPLGIGLDPKYGTEANATAVQRELKKRVEQEGTSEATSEAYKLAANQLKKLGAYPHAAECARLCEQLTEIMPRFNRYTELNSEMVQLKGGEDWKRYKYVSAEFEKLGGFRDSATLSTKTKQTADDIVRRLYDRGVNTIKAAKTHEDNDKGLAIIKALSSEILTGEAENLYEQKKTEIAKAIKAEEERKEAERLKAEAELAAAKRKKLIISIVATIVIIAGGLYLFVLQPMMNYNAAKTLVDAGKYEEAITVFEALNGYGDSADQIVACRYNVAMALSDSGKYEEAIAAFETLSGYGDSKEQIISCRNAIMDRDYNKAKELYDAGNYVEAVTVFKTVDGYKDSAEQIMACRYSIAMEQLDKGKYAEAYKILMLLKGYMDVDTLLAENENLKVAAATRDAKYAVGNYVTFGTYPQTKAGNDATGIEWLVIDRDGQKALLVSRYALDCQPYNTVKTSVTWETCSLRSWLNGTFINKAFSPEEQTGIITTSVDNGKSQGNSNWSTFGGNNTEDKVFLLSNAEAEKYFKNDDARMCAPTDYAVAQGGDTSISYKVDGRPTGSWWLRSPGASSSHAVFVNSFGWLDICNGVNYSDNVVRPALWINLESGIF